MLSNYEVEVLDDMLRGTKEPLRNILILAQTGLQEAQSKDMQINEKKLKDNQRTIKALERAIKQL